MKKVAPYDISVLIEGETGTGKELHARALHEWSGRRAAAFIPVNCATISDSLGDSQLFGHVAGAFTDAKTDRLGLFEQAHGGTLFLDEIGDMMPSVQAKVLRTLQSGELTPVGSVGTRVVSMRVISATNRDVDAMVRDGSFREDLFYRIGTRRIQLAPLRERPEDIPALASVFLKEAAERLGKSVVSVADEAVDALVTYPWPGNARELENVIENMVLDCESDCLTLAALPQKMKSTVLAVQKYRVPGEWSHPREIGQRVTREVYADALRMSGGDWQRAAELVSVPRSTFHRHCKRFGLL